MSSDLALTGLASGFDWKPVVDQLMELEAIPKRRLEREKIKNDEKMSELGLLKGQLDTLKGVSSALQNDDLFEARKVAIDENSAKVLYATADPGTMTGTYKVEVISLASSTAMTSILRKPKGLGAALHKSAANPNSPLVAFGQPGANDIALQDLPLQTQITKGTFTIEGKTFEIHDLSMGLKELMDTLNLDPEFDGKNVQLEYEEDPTRSGYDKIIIDSNISSAGGNPYIPTMGSPTDTSNFLQVMRLLNRQPDTPRPSDFEAGTAIGDWDALTTAAQTWANIKALNPVTDAKWMSWISQADLLYPSPSPTDDRIFMGYDPDGAGPNKTLMYRRKDPAVAGIAQFTNHPNQPGSETAWAAAGEKVYSDGYLWKTLSGLPTNSHAPGVDPAPTATKYRIAGGPEKGFYELAATFEGGGGLNVDAAAGQNFSTALAAGNHKPNTAGEYKKGNVVRAGDNSTSYFRAIRDRDDEADDLKNMAAFKGFANLKADDAAKAVSTWITTGTASKHGKDVFR
ncbi:MAG: flagellar cap protein FliD N-terminal domain-containing protein, partial [Opitutales bacterium]